MGRVRSRSVVVKVQTSGPVTVTVRVRQPKAVATPKQQLLTFGHGNAKLDEAIFTFSLPSGWTCPGARQCLAKTDEKTGRIKDGRNATIRCFSASDEQTRPGVRRSRWRNYRLLKPLNKDAMTELILASLSPLAGVVRIHVSGDFFNDNYMDAWLAVARLRPFTRFYCYTKSLRFWLARIDFIGTGHEPGTLPNVMPTASYGGTDDHLIELHGLRSARVVLSETEALACGLALDHDDSHAMSHGASFALLIHGMQAAGSAAMKAVWAQRAAGNFGYGPKADAMRAALRLSLPTLN